MISPSSVSISNTVNIELVDHLSEALIESNQNDSPVVPIGGGTCLSTGNFSAESYVGLDLTGLSGVIEYVPTDMTAAFKAGTPIRTVREVLAENGQELPIDLASDDAGTIGGLVATGFAGPRRYGQGTLKDLLIGCEYVRGDGLIAKAGGMTVKNVSGFEISRMLHGSWGSLAVLTRVNLKVLPIAREDRTISWHDADVTSAIDRQLRLLSQFPGATALQTVQKHNGWQTAIRFTGRNTSVDDYERQSTGIEGDPYATENRSDVWIAKPGTHGEPQLVVSASVGDLRTAITSLSQHGAASDMAFSFATGTLRAALNQESDFAGMVGSIPSSLWMIEGGSDEFRQQHSVWGPSRPDHTVMQSIKTQFDPGNILNRGRLFV